MTKDTCKIDGCDRPHRTRGWCKSHYMFWYRTGTAPAAPLKVYDPSRGCMVEGCDKPFAGGGYCAPHLKRFRAHGDPGPAEIKPRTVGDAASYALVHARLKKRRGRAALRDCIRCGDRAKHWSYDHGDVNEKVDDRGYAYSLDPDHYRPMCVKCHKRFDVDRLAAAPMQDASANF